MITQERLKELLHYDPETGVFTWNRALRKNMGRNGIAGTLKLKGNIEIQVDSKMYQAHRLAWLYVTGHLPVNQIDHRDTNPGNNRWKNLREATNLQNSQNRGKHKNNTSGYKGVNWHKRSKKWIARGRENGIRKNLGSFDTPEKASEAYECFSRLAHAEFYYQPLE